MDMITLPLLQESATAHDALQALRAHRARDLVATDGKAFWLYDFGEIADALRTDKRLRLKHVARTELRVLDVSAAASHGLDFALPEDAPFQSFFGTHADNLVLTATATHVASGGKVAALVARSQALGFQIAVYPKSWVCPTDNSEVWEDADKPASGLCPVHQLLLQEE